MQYHNSAKYVNSCTNVMLVTAYVLQAFFFKYKASWSVLFLHEEYRIPLKIKYKLPLTSFSKIYEPSQTLVTSFTRFTYVYTFNVATFKRKLKFNMLRVPCILHLICGYELPRVMTEF